MMQRSNRRSVLSQHISEIVCGRSTSAKNRRCVRSAASKTLISGGMALLVMAPVQLEAVGLGDLRVQSPLGRPLQAVVPMHVGKGETLAPNCVKPRKTQGELSQPPNLRVQSPVVGGPGTYDVRISTPGSLHEPMYELSLVINCPGTPVLVRHYVFMLDLPGMFNAAPAAKIPQAAVTQSQWTPGPDSPATPKTGQAAPALAGNNRDSIETEPMRSLEKSAAPIDAGTLYRVRRGDTLSTIAARIDGRLPNATWAVARRLFATNPAAFIANDRNLIKLGSLIRIPNTTELSAIVPDANGLTRRPTPGLTEPMPLPEPRPLVDAPSTAAPRIESSNAAVDSVQGQRDAIALQSDVATVGSTRETDQDSTSAGTADDQLRNSEVRSFADPGAVEADGISGAALENPFLDEATAAAAADTQPKTAPTAPVAGSPAEDDGINPWLAIGAGLLFGFVVAALVLRRRFQKIIVDLLPSRDLINALVGQLRKPKLLRKLGSSDTENAQRPSATAAFRTSADDGSGSIPLPIGDPMEKTYIVETQEDPPSQEIAQTPAETAVSADDAQLDEPVEFDEPLEFGEPAELEGSSPADKSDEDLLAEIFAEAPGDGTSAADGELEPTSRLPQTSDLPKDELFDPTSELPQKFVEDVVEDVLDPSTDMPFDPIADDDSSLMQAFTEKLEEVDPKSFDASAQIDDPGETVESERIATSADEEGSLGSLPNASDEDDELSETLYDALTLLERDYEDEFTASQILERTAIKESLATLEAQDEEKEDDDGSVDHELAG